MVIHSPNIVVEYAARIRYGMFLALSRTGEPEPVRYQKRRWYRQDAERRVTKVARTYFEVMQPG